MSSLNSDPESSPCLSLDPACPFVFTARADCRVAGQSSHPNKNRSCLQNAPLTSSRICKSSSNVRALLGDTCYATDSTLKRERSLVCSAELCRVLDINHTICPCFNQAEN